MVQQAMAEALSQEVIPKDAEKPEEILAEAVSSRAYRGANILKFFLMPFVCIASFGFPGPYGDLVGRLSLPSQRRSSPTVRTGSATVT